MKAWGIALASFIGALYSVLILLFEVEPVIELLLSVLICVLMTSIAMRSASVGSALKHTAVMFVSSSLLGGVMTVGYSYVLRYIKTSDESHISPTTFIILAVLSFCCAALITHSPGAYKSAEIVDVTIKIFGKEVEVRGIFDSGNMLKDPLSAKSVIIVSADIMGGVLSPEFISGALSGDVRAVSLITDNEKGRFRLIGHKSVGGGGYLFGVIPDSVHLIYDLKKRRVKRERDAVICLCKKDTFSGDFECIVPIDLA